MLKFYTVTFQGHNRPVGFDLQLIPPTDPDGFGGVISLNVNSPMILTSTDRDILQGMVEKFQQGIGNPYFGTPYTINEYDSETLEKVQDIIDRASDGVALFLGEEDVQELQKVLGM